MDMNAVEWQTSQQPIEYPDAIAHMEQQVEGIIAGTAKEKIWCLEHPSLYTAGTSANSKDLLDSTSFPVYNSGRGGEYTYHGPGQRVAYIMLDLKKRYPSPDIKQFVADLEQLIINTLTHFDVKGERRKERIGIWVRTGDKENKIAALGIRIRKWVSFHGIAINVRPDLSHFNGIVPCGISEHGVTSLHALGVETSLEEVDFSLKREFDVIFG